MSNARKATAKQPSTYKFSEFQKQAEKRRSDAPKPADIPPFIMDDVTPPIVITAPDTLERMMIIADFIGLWKSGNWDMSHTLPLLRAMCGESFGRVWMLVKDDPDPAVLTPLINAMFDHFNSVLEVAEEAGALPGGSGDSSN